MFSICYEGGFLGSTYQRKQSWLVRQGAWGEMRRLSGQLSSVGETPVRSCQQRKMGAQQKRTHTNRPRALWSPRSSTALSGPFCAQKPKLRIFKEEKRRRERRKEGKEEGRRSGGGRGGGDREGGEKRRNRLKPLWTAKVWVTESPLT